MSNTASDDQEEIRYRDAVEELEAILAKIEDEQVDLDDLSTHVDRAAFLIKTCRDRIQATEMSVRRILDGLAESTSLRAEADGTNGGES